MMEINIKFMSEEAYKTLQKNYKEVYKMILDHPSDCSWLKDYLVPKCERFGFCDEDKSCGRVPTRG